MNSCERLERRGKTVRRILSLIDIMATHFTPKTVPELTSILNEVTNEQFSKRTVYRDIIVLLEQGLIERQGRTGCTRWKLKLKRSEPLQMAAIELVDSAADRKRKAKQRKARRVNAQN